MTLSQKAVEAAAEALIKQRNNSFTNQARAAITAALAVDGLCLVEGWQPIESAPRDGTKIDLWVVDQDGNGVR